MITASILATFLALVTAPAGAAAAAGGPSTSAAASDEKISLNLKDADITKVLENFATLLGVTPIIAPGVSGTVTMEASASVSSFLRDFERDFQIKIRVVDGRMFVSRAAEPLLSIDDDAADLRYLANATLPRRPTAAAPKRFEGAIEIRTNAGGSTTFSLGFAGGITVPGCKFGLAILPLPGDRFDGLPALVLTGDGILPRLLSPSLEETTSVEVSGCLGPLLVRLQPSNVGAVAPLPLTPFGEFRIQVQIVEVSGTEEKVLSAPRLHVVGGDPAAIQSGTGRRSPGGLSLSQTVQAAFVVVDANEKRATVAVSSTVLREVDPRDGGQAVTIRIAHSRESASLAFGKSQRVVLSPTFGRGDSALVLDVVIERLPGKN